MVCSYNGILYSNESEYITAVFNNIDDLHIVDNKPDRKYVLYDSIYRKFKKGTLIYATTNYESSYPWEGRKEYRLRGGTWESQGYW